MIQGKDSINNVVTSLLKRHLGLEDVLRALDKGEQSERQVLTDFLTYEQIRNMVGNLSNVSCFKYWLYSGVLFAEIGEHVRACMQINRCLNTILRVLMYCETTKCSDWLSKVTCQKLNELLPYYLRICKRWTDAAYQHVGKYANSADDFLLGQLGEKIREENKIFCFKPIEYRECEIIVLQIELILLKNGSSTVNKDDLYEKIKKQARFFGYSAFPCRVRARFMELYGDLFSYLAQTLLKEKREGEEEKKRQKEMIEYCMEGGHAYLSAIHIRRPLGTSFSMTSFALGMLHYKLAKLGLTFRETVLIAKFGTSRGIDKKDELRVLKEWFDIFRLWSRYHNFPLSQSEIHYSRSDYQFDQAQQCFKNAISAHTLGQAFMDLYKQNYYLMDDFHSEDFHFGIAYEMFMMPYCDGKIKEIDAILEKIGEVSSQMRNTIST